MNKLPERLYPVSQVREFDRIAIEEYGISGFGLMNQAGKEIFDCMQMNFPNIKSCLVLCGAGNNGGDGYIVARLSQQAGIRTWVISVVDRDVLKGDALKACNAYLECGGQWQKWDEVSWFDADLTIDALLGSGLDRPVAGQYAKAIECINQKDKPVISADIPSGIHADTGKVMGLAVKADYTVSFVAMKQGLMTGDAPEYCGKLSFCSLNIPQQIYKSSERFIKRIDQPVFTKRKRTAHKGSCGHTLIIGGNFGYSGALRMSGEGALRVGSGLVSLATRSQHAGLINLTRPELMCHGVEQIEQFKALVSKASVLAIGPGLGQSKWSEMLFGAVLETGLPLVLDADALNLLSKAHLKSDNWVLTPHPGEAARLLKSTVTEVEMDRFAAVQEIQHCYGGICVLKGAGTLIANESGMSLVNAGNPGMASGGMGDILTGVIAGLIAQGFELLQAVEYGVFVHARAADLSAEQNGERGLLATDLLPFIQKLVN